MLKLSGNCQKRRKINFKRMENTITKEDKALGFKPNCGRCFCNKASVIC